MKIRVLGLLAAALLALFSTNSHAITITITGSGDASIDGDWEISTVLASTGSMFEVLTQQVWWDNPNLAELFTATLGNALGYPNSGGLRGPAFLVCDNACLREADPNGTFAVQGYRFGEPSPGQDERPVIFRVESTTDTFEQVYATAARVTAVPEPGTLALLGLGLSGLGVSRRRKA